MPYLVDGNNVMAQRVGWHRDKAAARRRLIRDLAVFVGATRAKLRVVFDGVPDDEFPEGRRFKSVQVHYARPGSDADTRIRELVAKSGAGRDIVVVTSDKALGSHVARMGAKVLRSGEFRRMIEDALSSVPDKPGDREPVDVDEWLDFFEHRDR
jgi:predicted RNA-binding protein with PIN domain